MRRPFEGTWNVVRFNWPRYGVGILVVAFTFTLAATGQTRISELFWCAGLVALVMLVLPLIASYWIYDRSGLYKMTWLDGLAPSVVLNMTAGFDESSSILAGRYGAARLVVVDFFDQSRHTEPSIARARKAYPPYPGTQRTNGHELPLQDASVDLAVGFLAVHEIREHLDRVRLLGEVHRVLTPQGTLMITEHLRDVPNAIAFSIGVLHFHSDRTWTRAFQDAGFRVEGRHRITPFIITYVLRPA
jgi:SAM-dependent methyltransferase